MDTNCSQQACVSAAQNRRAQQERPKAQTQVAHYRAPSEIAQIFRGKLRHIVSLVSSLSVVSREQVCPEGGGP